MGTDLGVHYEAVLADLKRQRAVLAEQVDILDKTIAGIQRTLPGGPLPSPPILLNSLGNEQLRMVDINQRFAHISVRWGAIWHLAESVEPQKTGEVTAALMKGGYRYNGKTFANSVSAVLSTMKAKGEVEPVGDDGYRLTAHGRTVWDAIRNSERFKAAASI